MRVNAAVLGLCTALAACGTDNTVSVADTAAALEATQTDFCTFRAAADACRATFEACRSAEGADEAACRTALHDCLPPPPARAERGGDGCEGMGGMGRGPGMGGGEHGRRGGRGGRGGPPGPRPEPAAVQACRDALATCLSTDPADTTCAQTERTCVGDAFRAAFDAACAAATATCAAVPEDACTRLTQRCAEGVDGRVGPDGEVCSTTAVVP